MVAGPLIAYDSCWYDKPVFYGLIIQNAAASEENKFFSTHGCCLLKAAHTCRRAYRRHIKCDFTAAVRDFIDGYGSIGCIQMRNDFHTFQGSEFFNDFPGVCGYADVRKIGYGDNGICRVDKCPAGAFLSVKDCFHFFPLSFNNRDLIWLVMCFGMVSSISMSLLYMRTPW